MPLLGKLHFHMCDSIQPFRTKWWAPHSLLHFNIWWTWTRVQHTNMQDALGGNHRLGNTRSDHHFPLVLYRCWTKRASTNISTPSWWPVRFPMRAATAAQSAVKPYRLHPGSDCITRNSTWGCSGFIAPYVTKDTTDRTSSWHTWLENITLKVLSSASCVIGCLHGMTTWSAI